jgi:hypothetical protein
VLHGTVWPSDLASEQSFAFDHVDYISFVSNTTYGKPAIIAPGTDGFVNTPEGGVVKVLYVNPANIAALEATKEND